MPFFDPDTGKKSTEHNCPVCDEEAIIVCNCDLQDSKCKNGHQWHHAEGKKVVGPGAHESSATVTTNVVTNG